MPPDTWANMSETEKHRRRAAEGDEAYADLQFFVFAPHDLLPQYDLVRRKVSHRIGHWAVDFKEISCVKCSDVNSPKCPAVKLKILQLSIESRSALREKLAYFFHRVPREDIV